MMTCLGLELGNPGACAGLKTKINATHRWRDSAVSAISRPHEDLYRHGSVPGRMSPCIGADSRRPTILVGLTQYRVTVYGTDQTD